MLTSVCGGSNRVHFEGSGSLKGHLCIFGSLSRAQGPFFTTGLLFGIFMCTFSKVIWVLWGSTKLSFKRERVTFSNLTLRRRNWADNQPASDRSSSRGAKPQNFPDSNFLRAKTFQTKCAKRFPITSLKSTLLPLTTLPKNV